MLWDTFVELQIPKVQLQRYDRVLVEFLSEHVEVRRYVKLRTTITEGTLA